MISLENEHYLVEMFSSVQGEGPYIGYRQIFIRYSNCNLQCTFCDTPTNQLNKFCTVEETPGQRNFSKITNPVSTETIIKLTNKWNPGLHHSISFTGGEPLLNISNLKALMKRVKELNLKTFLETNGTLIDNFHKVRDLVDIVSMDIKLPSLTGTDYYQQHGEFLNLARNKDIYVKIVIAEDTKLEEFLKSVDIIYKIKATIPLIIQPVTPFNGNLPPNPWKVLAFQEKALEKLVNVRVIPQTHKFIGQL